MISIKLKHIICISSLLMSATVFAGVRTASGTLTNSDNTTLQGATDSCFIDNEPYDLVGPFQVSETGDYEYGDISIDLDADGFLDMAIGIYSGPFNPNDTGDNQLGVSDDSDTFELSAGQDYYAVVQALTCNGELGDWVFALIGPGNVTGNFPNTIPNQFVAGEFDGSEQEIDAIACGADDYHTAFGPFKLPAGSYEYYDLGYNELDDNDLDVQVALYKGSFDPDNTNQNLIGIYDDDEDVNLSGGSYFMVVQPYECGENPTEEGFVAGFVLVAAAPVAIPTLSSWSLFLLTLTFLSFGFYYHRRRMN